MNSRILLFGIIGLLFLSLPYKAHGDLNISGCGQSMLTVRDRTHRLPLSLLEVAWLDEEETLFSAARGVDNEVEVEYEEVYEESSADNRAPQKKRRLVKRSPILRDKAVASFTGSVGSGAGYNVYSLAGSIPCGKFFIFQKKVLLTADPIFYNFAGAWSAGTPLCCLLNFFPWSKARLSLKLGLDPIGAILNMARPAGNVGYLEELSLEQALNEHWALQVKGGSYNIGFTKSEMLMWNSGSCGVRYTY